MPLISEFPVAGPQGKQGPVGPEGKQGPEGKRGPMGPAGPGTGDMLAMVYDPQGKATDVYKYTDDAAAGRADLTLSNLSNKQKALRNIGGRPNRNLLDNWYFAGGGSQQGGGQFPINQRGQTSYTGTGYGIDRWKSYSSSANAEITDGGIEISGTNGVPSLWQPLPNDMALPGKRYTLTVILTNVTGSIRLACRFGAGGDSDDYLSQSSIDISSEGLHCVSFEVPSSAKTMRIGFSSTSTGNANLVAAKLELGSTQTLAYQDEDGNWQLFETPDYAEELAKYQRYLQVIGGTTTSPLRLQSAYVNPTNIFFSVPIPAPMRNGNPTISLPSGATLLVNAGGGGQSGFTFSAINHGNCITIVANKDSHGLTSNDFPILIAQNVLLDREL